ncbi:MAG TPA: SRPBCC domain-containing protein [Solirubrobacteraceae bacterium]
MDLASGEYKVVFDAWTKGGRMTDATLLTDRARPAVRLERLLPDPPATVWRALTDRERLRSWFPSDVIVEGGRWVAGAAITFPFPPEIIDMTLIGRVLEVDEPNVLVFTWGDDALRFELTPHEGGTRLVLIDELPASGAARNAAGWDTCLDRLAGLEPSAEAWPPRFAVYVALFEPALGTQEGPPAGYKGDPPARKERHGNG